MKWLDEIKAEAQGKQHIPKEWVVKQLEIIKGKINFEFRDKIQYYNSTKILKPQSIMKYDIVYSAVCGIPHPILIFKVDATYCYGIVISSTDGSHCLCKIHNSRFFKDSCATITLVKEKQKTLVDKWIGTFDNKKEADRIITLFKKNMNNL